MVKADIFVFLNIIYGLKNVNREEQNNKQQEKLSTLFINAQN